MSHLVLIIYFFGSEEVLEQRLAFRPLIVRNEYGKKKSFTQSSSLRLNPKVTVASLFMISRFSLLYVYYYNIIFLSLTLTEHARAVTIKNDITHSIYVHTHYNNNNIYIYNNNKHYIHLPGALYYCYYYYYYYYTTTVVVLLCPLFLAAISRVCLRSRCI